MKPTIALKLGIPSAAREKPYIPGAALRGPKGAKEDGTKLLLPGETERFKSTSLNWKVISADAAPLSFPAGGSALRDERLLNKREWRLFKFRGGTAAPVGATRRRGIGSASLLADSFSFLASLA